MKPGGKSFYEKMQYKSATQECPIIILQLRTTKKYLKLMPIRIEQNYALPVPCKNGNDVPGQPSTFCKN